jgi:AmpE protein
MTLIALFLGLAIERLATRLLHLREPRWFDGYLEWTLGRFRGARGAGLIVLTTVLVLLPVLPVAIIAAYFYREAPLLAFAYVAFAVLVLVFSLGPRDLKDEVDDYIDALRTGDEARAGRVSRELLEHDAAQRTGSGANTLEEAIFVQTNNRIFGVAFWFMIAGPAGAWAFRVSDLMRRRAVFEYRERATDPTQVPEFVRALQIIHGVMAWAPARLLALGFALAGSFDRAISEWRQSREASAPFFDVNDQLLARVGSGALEAPLPAGETASPVNLDRVRSCIGLVHRTLLIWLVFVSALVVIGWVR